MSRNPVISIEPFDFEDDKQKGRPQLSTTVKHIVNGKETVPLIETPFIFHQYSKFASSKFYTPDQRNFLKLEFYKNQRNCDIVKALFSAYDTCVKDTRGMILGKYDKLYTYIDAVKVPSADDDDELILSINKNKAT
jgi:leucyl-tRNA synthetase